MVDASNKDLYRKHEELLPAIEEEFDSYYTEIPLPHLYRGIAIWYFLSVLEDYMRRLLLDTRSENAPFIEFELDRLKYSARFGLARIFNECKSSHVKLPVRILPKNYLQTFELIKGGRYYIAATQLCSSAHMGTVKFSENETHIEADIDRAHHDARYGALGLIGTPSPGMIDHSTLFYSWSKFPDQLPPVVTAIARSVKIVDQQIIYKYSEQMAFALSQSMSAQPQIIPEEWQFPWGGQKETNLLLNSLSLRCLYHLVAVHYGATYNGLKGDGDGSILLCCSAEELILDIQKFTSLPGPIVRAFVKQLTYGFKMIMPDPALQPIVPMGSKQVCIPVVLFLSSNHERNLLSLQARIDSPFFDSQSKLFEKEMVWKLIHRIQSHWSLVKGNIEIRDNGRFEEIDLIIVDPSSHTILAVELRWMLAPGDPREVQNRRKVSWQKVFQLQRKIEWLAPLKSKILKEEFGIEVGDEELWNLEGIVILQNYWGALSPVPQYPIMPQYIFELGLENANSLAQFVVWSQSLSWLPQENLHFKIATETDYKVLGKKLTVEGVIKMTTQVAYFQHVVKSLEMFIG